MKIGTTKYHRGLQDTASYCNYDMSNTARDHKVPNGTTRGVQTLRTQDTSALVYEK